MIHVIIDHLPDKGLNAMKDLRDWIPTPASPTLPPIPYPNRLNVTPRFSAEVRPSRVPPVPARDNETMATKHTPPPPDSEDDDIVITAHVLPSHPPDPRPPSPPGPASFLTCGFCRRSLWVGWLLVCGHGIHDKCYLAAIGEPTEEDIERPFMNAEMDCPARGCRAWYVNEMVWVKDRWRWQPTRQTHHFRAG
ncbi:hypothetical protein FRC08_004865 [Ceratobasidium sp. 394]|nr:hypothetical protein FRC08_004865 [Ceratobasidium sp. 394]